MPLVAAKCTQCGAELQVDSSHEAAVCQFCGTPFIVEKAINNYNTYVTQNFAGANVTIQGITAESLITRANQYLMDNQWDTAEKYIEDALDIDPYNSKAWVLKLLIYNKCVTLKDAYNKEIDLSKCNIYEKVMKYVSKEDAANIVYCVKETQKKLAHIKQIEKEQNYIANKKKREKATITLLCASLLLFVCIGFIFIKTVTSNIMQKKQEQLFYENRTRFAEEVKNIELGKTTFPGIFMSGEEVKCDVKIVDYEINYELAQSEGDNDKCFLIVHYEGDLPDLHSSDISAIKRSYITDKLTDYVLNEFETEIKLLREKYSYYDNVNQNSIYDTYYRCDLNFEMYVNDRLEMSSQ